MARQESALEKSMKTIMGIFDKYALMGGDADTLTKKEFKELMNNELPNFLQKETRDKKAIEELMEDLDTNQDSQLDLDEFMELITRVMRAMAE